jgi:hypothetical protein
MANGSRTLSVVLALVVGLAAGWLIFHGKPEPTPVPERTPAPTAKPPAATLTPTPICPPQVTPAKKADWNLTVGPDVCKVADDDDNGKQIVFARLSRDQGNKIVFKPSSEQLSLAIIFHVPRDVPKPFMKLTFAGYDSQGLVKWILVCDDEHKRCTTGPVNPNATYGCYKYDQILDGKECDAGLIIER